MTFDGPRTKRKPLTPIIKAVGDYCNLRCLYCFYSRQNQSRKTVMSQPTLESFLRQYFELFGGPACFIWHGGEPLLAGIPFYEFALDLQKDHRSKQQRVENLIQTNATLITDQWAEFFRSSGFRVGVSIDGDALAHDAFRIDQRGAGSFTKVWAGIEALRRHKVAFGVVMVLTARNSKGMRPIFRFLTEKIGAKNISINAFTDENQYSRACSDVLQGGQFAAAIRDCMAEWPQDDAEGLRVREVDSIVAGVMGKRSRACTYNGGCRNYFCVNHDGAIYPCDNFTSQPEMKLGTLASETLSSILDGSIRSAVLSRFESIHADCQPCQWYSVCHNGCPGQRVGGIEGKYSLCEDRRELFLHVKNCLASVEIET